MFIKPAALSAFIKTRLTETIKFESKKPYNFDGNQKRSALSKKEQPNTTGKKLRKFIRLLGQ